MKTQVFFARWRIHFLFGGGFLLVFAINVAINLTSGQTLLRSTVAALLQIRPMEYIMFLLFWYAFARGRQSDSRSTFTALNLGVSRLDSPSRRGIIKNQVSGTGRSD